MRTIVLVGGNSGIGRHVAVQLAELGERLVLVGRDAAKGEQVVATLGGGGGQATFIAADLSTHDGVRSAAEALLTANDRIDALVHTSGVLIMNEARTADGLHPFFAVNTLSRYHLTQRLLPALRRGKEPRVIMMTSKVSPDTRVDLGLLPRFEPFVFRKLTEQIQVGNHHYAAHLARAEPWLRAGVVNAGVARTGIWRETPAWIRLATTLLGPLLFDPIERSAHNVLRTLTDDGWSTGTYWARPGRFDDRTAIAPAREVTEGLLAAYRSLTGV